MNRLAPIPCHEVVHRAPGARPAQVVLDGAPLVAMPLDQHELVGSLEIGGAGNQDLASLADIRLVVVANILSARSA